MIDSENQSRGAPIFHQRPRSVNPHPAFLASQTPSGTLPSVRAIVLAIFAATLSLSVPSARADTKDATPDPDGSAWVGRYCTPTGCAGAPSSPIVQAASFGTAALSIAFLSRRRRA
jgi:hypothetical protein